MQINVPDEIWTEFVSFLDIAQFQYTENDVERFSPNDQRVYELVRELIGNTFARPLGRNPITTDTVKADSEQLKPFIGGLYPTEKSEP